MHFFDGLDAVDPGFGPSAVAIGKFDGVHTGHRAVLSALRELADARGLMATVVTFDRNPLALLRPESCPDPLVSNAQKVELLAETGVDATLMLEFDRALSSMPAEEFVRRVLVDALRARVVLAGSDFRFGARGAGDFALLERLGGELGFEAVVVADVLGLDGDGGRRASSTWIRELLDAGEIRQARLLLGRRPTLRSIVVHGEHRGRALGYPTANLDPAIEGFVPADGVYAAWATVDGIRFPAAVSIGDNPTFEGVPERQVEAYLLDVDLDLYGRVLELAFVDRIRPMIRFDGVEALVARLGEDVAETRTILDADQPHPRHPAG